MIKTSLVPTLTQLFDKCKWGQVKRARGSKLVAANGLVAKIIPLATSLKFVGRGRDTSDADWLLLPSGNWIKQTDVWLEDEPLITKQEPALYAKTYIINPRGSLAVDRYGGPQETIPAGNLKIVADAEDVLGQKYLELSNHIFVSTNDCLFGPDADVPLPKQTFVLPTENINQNFWHIINGCEAAALLTGLHYQGKVPRTHYQEFVDQMPLAEDYNPYHGFGGSPYDTAKGHFEAIFPPALIRWGQKYTHLNDLSGEAVSNLIPALQRKNPVLTYVTVNFTEPEPDVYPWGKTYKNNHAVLLDGYSDTGLLHVSDPINGHYWITPELFNRAYNGRRWAIEIMN